MKKMLTLPQKRLQELGLTTVQIARKMNPGVRLTKKQLQNRAATVSRVLRQGNCGEDYARRLARLLDVSPDLLELPCQCWPPTWQGMAETKDPAQGTTVTPTHASTTAGGANQGSRLGSRRRPSPNRIEILRLVPMPQAEPTTEVEE